MFNCLNALIKYGDSMNLKLYLKYCIHSAAINNKLNIQEKHFFQSNKEKYLFMIHYYEILSMKHQATNFINIFV